MPEGWRRRELLVAGLGLLIAGCGRRSSGIVARVAQPGSAPAGSASAPGLWYIVETGDTLSSISRRSGLGIEAIADKNRLATPLIRPGQRLWLPGVSGLQVDPLAPQALATAAAPVEVGPIRLIDRAGWNAPRPSANNNPMNGVTRITLHHTGEHAGTIGQPDVEVVRRIDRYHREGRKWACIGYHWLIGIDGRIYEGRPASLQGAHVSAQNANNLGISVIGDFHQKLPNAVQLATLAAFLEQQRRRYRVPTNKMFAHRDLGNSICPGDRLYRWYQGWKQAQA